MSLAHTHSSACLMWVIQVRVSPNEEGNVLRRLGTIQVSAVGRDMSNVCFEEPMMRSDTNGLMQTVDGTLKQS